MSTCYACAKAGDRAALEGIVRRIRPRVEKMSAYYARRTGEDAEDLLQEAWHGLLAALGELDPEIGSPDQFLIRHARWRMLDSVKRQRIRRCVRLDDPCAALPDSRAALDTALVRQFLESLPRMQRAVVECLLCGMTWREAGERLGCSSANIAYHMRLIRRRYGEWTGAD